MLGISTSLGTEYSSHLRPLLAFPSPCAISSTLPYRKLHVCMSSPDNRHPDFRLQTSDTQHQTQTPNTRHQAPGTRIRPESRLLSPISPVLSPESRVPSPNSKHSEPAAQWFVLTTTLHGNDQHQRRTHDPMPHPPVSTVSKLTREIDRDNGDLMVDGL